MGLEPKVPWSGYGAVLLAIVRSLAIPPYFASPSSAGDVFQSTIRHNDIIKAMIQMAQHVIPAPDNADRIRDLSANTTLLATQFHTEPLLQHLHSNLHP